MVRGLEVPQEAVDGSEGRSAALEGGLGLGRRVGVELGGEGRVGDERGREGVPVSALGIGNEDVTILEGRVGEGNGGGEEGQV